MRKLFLCAVLVLTISMSFAQKGNNAINLGPDLYFPIRHFGQAYKAALGGHLKGLLGVGSSGQVSLTVGYTSFKGKKTNTYDYSSQKFSVIPILLGYRHLFTNWFVEPQLGMGSSNIKFNGNKILSQTKFMYSIGGGYLVNGFEISLGLQNVGETGEIALRGGIAYNIPLGKK